MTLRLQTKSRRMRNASAQALWDLESDRQMVECQVPAKIITCMTTMIQQWQRLRNGAVPLGIPSERHLYAKEKAMHTTILKNRLDIVALRYDCWYNPYG